MSMDSQGENSKRRKFQKDKNHLTGINEEVISGKGDCEIHQQVFKFIKCRNQRLAIKINKNTTPYP